MPLRLLAPVEGCSGDLIRFSSDGTLMLTAGAGRAGTNWSCGTQTRGLGRSRRFLGCRIEDLLVHKRAGRVIERKSACEAASRLDYVSWRLGLGLA